MTEKGGLQLRAADAIGRVKFAFITFLGDSISGKARRTVMSNQQVINSIIGNAHVEYTATEEDEVRGDVISTKASLIDVYSHN